MPWLTRRIRCIVCALSRVICRRPAPAASRYTPMPIPLSGPSSHTPASPLNIDRIILPIVFVGDVNTQQRSEKEQQYHNDNTRIEQLHQSTATIDTPVLWGKIGLRPHNDKPIPKRVFHVFRVEVVTQDDGRGNETSENCAIANGSED